MKTYPDCIPCFQRQALQAARFISDEPELLESVLRGTMKCLSSMKWDTSPMLMANKVHSLVRDELGGVDPYQGVKKASNDIILKKYDELKKIVDDSSEPVNTAIRLSIAGNIIDYGAMNDFDLDRTISDVLNKDFTVDCRTEMLNSLETKKSIMYLADNAGEIVLDKLFLETLSNHYDINKVLFVVKKTPFINDATLEDAKYAGLDELEYIEFVEAGIQEKGMKIYSEDFYNLINSAGTVISKGQGNYEAMSAVDGIFHMLIIKCPVVSADIELPQGDIVVWRKDA
ncbi:MAG: ARMT1-like domain-containing protein [Thermoplasmata archaeon]